MHNIKSINLSKLRKYELPHLAEKVINVVESFEPEELKIKETFDLLADQKSDIKMLMWEYGPHEVTLEMNKLRVKRAAYAGVISAHARALSHDGVEGSDAGVKSVGLITDLYLTNLRRHNEGTIHGKLHEFFRHIDAREDLEIAFTSMGLASYLDSLRSIHSTLNEQWNIRDSSIAVRPNAHFPSITKSVRYALSNLFAHINFAQTKNVELDYSLLISELNKKITHYTSLINNRMTASEKKKAQEEAEAKAEAEKGAENETQTADISDVKTEMIIPIEKMTSQGVVDEKAGDNAFINPTLNEEKTAASSSKNEQLPSIDGETK